MAKSTADIVQFNFTGRTVLVTGGTTGIGAAIAQAYLDAGAEVIVTGMRKAATDYDSAPPNGAAYRKLDLSAPEDAAAIAASLPRLDILVNNAGGATAQEDFAAAVETTLTAVHRLTTALKPQLAKSDLPGGAAVVHILSSMAFFGNSFFPGYSAAKGGLLVLTKSMATAWASDKIRINAVAPGPVRTRMTARFADDPQYGPATAARMALGRWGEPEDIAQPVLFLSSPAAAFITGECLVVSGGYLISES
jgi:3-oxoacyl-[acyl-carrier protein] reductase